MVNVGSRVRKSPITLPLYCGNCSNAPTLQCQSRHWHYDFAPSSPAEQMAGRNRVWHFNHVRYLPKLVNICLICREQKSSAEAWDTVMGNLAIIHTHRNGRQFEKRKAARRIQGNSLFWQGVMYIKWFPTANEIQRKLRCKWGMKTEQIKMYNHESIHPSRSLIPHGYCCYAWLVLTSMSAGANINFSVEKLKSGDTHKRWTGTADSIMKSFIQSKNVMNDAPARYEQRGILWAESNKPARRPSGGVSALRLRGGGLEVTSGQTKDRLSVWGWTRVESPNDRRAREYRRSKAEVKSRPPSSCDNQGGF